jgi:hypothetical protein
MSTRKCVASFGLLILAALSGCDGWSPSPTAQFWLNWTVYLLSGVGTVGAVCVALFREFILSRLLPSRLRLSLRTDRPPISFRTVETARGPVTKQERFYHLRLSNGRRWAPVKSVRAVITRIDQKHKDGSYEMRWGGETPMRWEHQEFVPVTRAVGPEGYVDLCFLTEGNGSVFFAPQYRSLQFSKSDSRTAAYQGVVRGSRRGQRLAPGPDRDRLGWQVVG